MLFPFLAAQIFSELGIISTPHTDSLLSIEGSNSVFVWARLDVFACHFFLACLSRKLYAQGSQSYNFKQLFTEIIFLILLGTVFQALFGSLGSSFSIFLLPWKPVCGRKGILGRAGGGAKLSRLVPLNQLTAGMQPAASGQSYW